MSLRKLKAGENKHLIISLHIIYTTRMEYASMDKRYHWGLK